MINFKYLEDNRDKLRMDFLLSKPFPFLIIDHFCDETTLEELYNSIPEITTKSRDYVFARNKFEKSKIKDISPAFAEYCEEILSDRFKNFISYITNQELFVDPNFFGGGIHQGKEKSFLDMHLDFNYHPLHTDWYRSLNILFYLNKDWKEEDGGHLSIEDLRTGEKLNIGVPYNRLVLQLTNSFTLHGYDVINFPPGKYRTSIAAYAYMKHLHHVEKRRTTDWHVGDDQTVKKFLSSIYDPAVKIKNKLFGSATAKH
jgi:hypothetical protein